MRKLALLMAIVLALSAPLSAMAVTPRAIDIVPSITIDGTKAICSVYAQGDTAYQYLEATIKLWRGPSCIATWNEENYGYIDFSVTKNISWGFTYKLTVDLTVDGVAQPQVYVTAEH